MKKRTGIKLFLVAAASLLFMFPTAAGRSDAPKSDVEVAPDNLMVTFFPVTLLEAFAGVTKDQAAKINAVETKLDADRSAANDDDEKRKFRRQADSDIKKILLPAQMDTLSRCALKLQIFTNTFGHKRLSKFTLTPTEVSEIQPILQTAYTQYMQANQERDQEVTAFPAQTERGSAGYDKIDQERKMKIKAMRAEVRTSVEPILTDAQRAALIDSPGPK